MSRAQSQRMTRVEPADVIGSQDCGQVSVLRAFDPNDVRIEQGSCEISPREWVEGSVEPVNGGLTVINDNPVDIVVEVEWRLDSELVSTTPSFSEGIIVNANSSRDINPSLPVGGDWPLAGGESGQVQIVLRAEEAGQVQVASTSISVGDRGAAVGAGLGTAALLGNALVRPRL